jgi:hypothetical protein
MTDKPRDNIEILNELMQQGSEKIADLIRERDQARQEAADLRKALRDSQDALTLAVNILEPSEPPDSRAVSDEFVALASVSIGDYSPEVMAVIRRERV